ncbi:transcriptional regulator PpsR [Fulvimarina sp. 2208YS6-2-32]|uniref:Transcriptional regulator PpsR n=1 Tax=Fulvimarina uroteuthidis TaxID=3098149 RepID=A0ABU5HZI9_9HYPH|nr:transcriptional regulator PpsR [Fulvimarina sp. 2208YS6-2-32]MDY8108502.1 transcriptional regulator PpsR [Fulvimarina sp. 2208YS6-2-32]
MGVNYAEGGRAFTDPDRSFSDMDPGLVASLVTATADFALLIDADGRVVDVAMRHDVCPPEVYQAWIGKPFIDIVTSECKLKAKRLLSDGGNRADIRREINHAIPGAGDLPVSYTMLTLTKDGSRVALGRDLRSVSDLQQRLISAQLSYDHEFERVRSIEAQYRILFETGAETRLVIDPATRLVTEANAVARASCGAKDVVGTSAEELFARDSLTELDRLIAIAHSSGRTENGVLRLRDDDRTRVAVALRFFRHLGNARLSLQIQPLGDAAFGQQGGRADDLLAKLGFQLPEALIVLDSKMRIVVANQSYLDLVQIPELTQIVGRDLSGSIGNRGVELRVLKNAVDNQGIVRSLSTQLTPAHGMPITVDIGGTSFESGGDRYYGFVIRRRERPAMSPVQAGAEVRPANDMIGLVGQMPLRDIVRDTTDIIERLCIEAALELTGDNRASAAELLGISRQALYTKLRRFGIIGEAGDAR